MASYKYKYVYLLDIFILGALTVAVTGDPCMPTSAAYFQLPGATTTWTGSESVDGGIQLIDVNGDSLVDLVFGYSDGPDHHSFDCIYLNTQCAWVLQANYTGPDYSCITSSPLAIHVRGVRMRFKGLSVKDFSAEVAEYFELRRADVEVRVGGPSGELQGPTCLMNELAATGFHVILVKTEVYPFVGISSDLLTLRTR